MFKKTLSLVGILTTVCILFCSCSLGALFGFPDTPGNINEKPDKESLLGDDGKISYTKFFNESNTAYLPLMPTDFDEVFYTMTRQGKVDFYMLVDGALTSLPETGVYNVKVTCSGQQIPAAIHYVTIDGKTNGFGLYTASSQYQVMMFDYAFFKICELPSAQAKKGSLLLMIDTDKNRFYKEKVYSEQFYLKTADLSTTYYLAEGARQTGMDGLKMKDFKMFTDEILNQPFQNTYFFSSRSYIADTVKAVDIYASGNYGLNADNTRIIKNVIGMTFMRIVNKGLYYFYKTANGFNLNNYDGKNITTIKEFTGDFDTDYIRNGNCILQKTTGDLYHCSEQKEYLIDYNRFGSGFVLTDFYAGKDFAVLIGSSPVGGIQIGVVSLADGTLTVFDDFTSKNMEKIHITDSGYLVVSVCYQSDYTAYQLIANLNNLL